MFEFMSRLKKNSQSETTKQQILELQSQVVTLQEGVKKIEDSQQRIVGSQDSDHNIQYPSAELLVQACYEDYKNTLESYNKIYDKVNVALAFCGVIILKLIDRLNFGEFEGLLQKTTIISAVFSIIDFLFSLGSAFLIIAAVVELTKLLASKKVNIFDSVDFYNNKRFLLKPDQLALSLVYAYTGCIRGLRKVTNEKQAKYDCAVEEIVGSVILYAISEMIK